MTVAAVVAAVPAGQAVVPAPVVRTVVVANKMMVVAARAADPVVQEDRAVTVVVVPVVRLQPSFVSARRRSTSRSPR